jgi:hypothetical protein
MSNGNTILPRKSSIRVLRWLGVIGLTLIGAVVVFSVVFSAIPDDNLKPSWTASSGAPTPPEFHYAMFPVNATVPLCDAPSGKPVGVLARALVNSQAEIDAGGWVRVLDPAGVTWAPMTELRYLPVSNASEDYFEPFRTAYQARDPSGFRSASLRLREDSSGVTIATLRLSQDDYWQSYVYEVSEDRVRPLEMHLVSGVSQGLAAFGRSVFALGAVVIYLVVVGLAAIVLVLCRRKATPRSTHA